MQYLLDTDTLTLLVKGHPGVNQKVAKHSTSELFTSVITVEEQLTGWYSKLRRTKQSTELARIYFKLQQTVQYLGRINVMPFTVLAIDRWEILRHAKLYVGSMDLKIAAIALEHQAIVVSRNVRDFNRVPGLVVEDWSV